ncbi:ABC transporter ATP-binding protein [Paenibacillus sp. HB172176]|uniref:ABC transporter ATP-binding protein n=1 Tax=Paenibacillus sp. HB172176 TaxID=2493690 RepID=UPI00143CA3EE|nr:ABC transporter ATP-binding protein [Paenibacillus sp. HB172176]
MDIQIEALNKVYSGEKQALCEVNLKIGVGMFGLLGPNGAGKSTLMQILATIIPPTNGRVQMGSLILGRDDHQIRQCLGYLPQTSRFFDKLTGEEFLHYIALLKGIKSAKDRRATVCSLLEKVNLQQQAKQRLKTYSGGMKQRIGIAQALLGNPQIIIVDEPTAGLDPEERIRFRELLEDLGQDRTIILSTHIVADIEASCQSLAILDRGKIVFYGSIKNLLSKVEDQVWTAIIPESDYLWSRNRTSLVSRRKMVSGDFEVRMIAERCPYPGAQLAMPNLEDAYLYFTRGEAGE